MEDHAVIGFDLRISLARVRKAPWWENSRLDPFLLCPLSIDPDCWPRPEGSELFTHSPVRPWQTAHYFTANIDTYIHAYQSHGIPTQGFVCAAFTVDIEQVNVIDSYYGRHWLETGIEPQALVEKGWTFCGYDSANVIDLVSALKAFSYTDHDRECLAGLKGDLNKFGLFDHEAIARMFCEQRSTMVADHGPYAPIGIYIRN